MIRSSPQKSAEVVVEERKGHLMRTWKAICRSHGLMVLDPPNMMYLQQRTVTGVVAL